MPRPTAADHQRRAFTLVEVMISLAIAMILILGISQIFSLAQRTTGAGMQVLSVAEANRGIQGMFQSDVRSIVTGSDSPGLVIVSYPALTWRNRTDQQQDNDGNPKTLNDPSTPGGSLANELANTIDDRVHRLDMLCFFARSQFGRRTGEVPSADGGAGPDCLVSPTTSREAFIWYGHLALPDNKGISGWQSKTPDKPAGGGLFWSPAAGTLQSNPNNFCASDWILGRQVILLALNPSTGALETNFTGLSVSPPTQDPLALIAPAITSPTLSQAFATDSAKTPLYASRYDLADCSISGYQKFIKNANYGSWWQSVSGSVMTSALPASMTNQVRYLANPYLIKPPAGAASPIEALSSAVAQNTPIFVRGCSQFIVEFAGDFLNQRDDGTINGPGTDGKIDFFIDPATGARKTRWYGFPRDTGAGVSGNQGVVPLGTLLNPSAPTAVEFERAAPPAMSPAWTSPAGASNLPATYAQPYICAWDQFTDAAGFQRPKMLRITIAIDDPLGHLNTQQVFEYVLNLP